ncbi:MAG: hypothetical protein KIT36_10070 [Alphaproteobacteria bacterium]|nr:hypothetical protein [Alphaproteobacteria bacterium]
MEQVFGPITVRSDGLDDRRGRQYVAQVLGMLRALDTIASSRAVINAVRFHRKPILIRPYDGSLGPCNAAAGGDWGLFPGKVLFTPYLHGRHSPCTTGKSGEYEAGDSPFESLIHEMTHAVRAVAGKLGSLSAGDEEEVAMLVANIYSSETHRPLRARYEDNSAVDEDDAAYGQSYFADNHDLLRDFHRQQPDFTRWLARVNCPFNPLKAYFNEVRPPGW